MRDIKQVIRYLEDSQCDQKQGDSYQEIHNEVLNISIKALEKQIPKQVAEKELVYKNNFDGYCPHCSIYITSAYQHCPNCGQKLDWD